MKTIDLYFEIYVENLNLKDRAGLILSRPALFLQIDLFRMNYTENPINL